jgi:hypothetical protein
VGIPAAVCFASIDFLYFPRRDGLVVDSKGLLYSVLIYSVEVGYGNVWR